MSYNQTNGYDVDVHLAEIYDQAVTENDDIALLRRLIGAAGPWRILEPFCGTGRILIPLALDGHQLVGLDQAEGMLQRARGKAALLPAEVQGRVALAGADVVAAAWPGGFDLVVLGGNCFYELATPEEQERCIMFAAGALRAGGYVYVDNDHMEGNLDESWQDTGVVGKALSGICQDGTRVESWRETVWYDVPRRLARFRRLARVTLPNNQVVEQEYIQQKHPVSAVEVRQWLEDHGFTVEQAWGDYAGNPYAETSERAIFWARKAEREE